jgi:hypothetical protein
VGLAYGSIKEFHLAPKSALLCCCPMPSKRNRPKRERFNRSVTLPFQLRLEDFEIAMQDVYDLFYDVNTGLLDKGLERLDDFLRPAIMSGLLSDLLTASLAKHSRTLAQNAYFNGHPDLVVKGAYPNDSVKAGEEGVEIKTTRKAGGAVDTHGARNQWMAVFVYNTDNVTEPARERSPMSFTEVYLGQVTIEISGEIRAANLELAPQRSIARGF